MARPTKLTPAVQKKIAECFFLAFNDEQTALVCGISTRTIERARHGEFCRAIKVAEMAKEAAYRQKIWRGSKGWQGAAWFLERKYPTQFSRPEVQLNLGIVNNHNQLSITLTGSEARAIEDKAQASRQRVEDMLSRYRPGGDGESVPTQDGNGNTVS